MEKYGVIDLGTNTFHLLIVQRGDGAPFKELYRERRFVNLADEGIEEIGEIPFKRGVDALIDFKNELKKFEVKKFRAIGTAALRIASNGSTFIEAVFEKTKIKVELVSGEEEARLIHLGVKTGVHFGEVPGMIMDIGGGSVEFIIANSEKVFWSQSFPVGVAVLFHHFHKNDPISETEIREAEKYLKIHLEPLLSELPKYPNLNLIGASGAFEVVENILADEKKKAIKTTSVPDFLTLHQKILKSSLEERLKMDGLPAVRAKLIVVAFLLIDFVIRHSSIREIVVCDYAMKEGILFEMMEA